MSNKRNWFNNKRIQVKKILCRWRWNQTDWEALTRAKWSILPAPTWKLRLIPSSSASSGWVTSSSTRWSQTPSSRWKKLRRLFTFWKAKLCSWSAFHTVPTPQSSASTPESYKGWTTPTFGQYLTNSSLRWASSLGGTVSTYGNTAPRNRPC